MQKKLNITIIGISDKKPEFSDNIQEIIKHTENFAGGKRHWQLLNNLLPKKNNWLQITVPLSLLFSAINKNNKPWVIFASGDPLFFGIANTLYREFPHAKINIIPYFNSLQILGHRMNLAYGKFQTISLTGRSWHEFDQALILGVRAMGILTDRKKTPSVIASRLLKYGYSNYKMYYGEHLEGENEYTKIVTLQEAVNMEFNHPNCLFLEMTDIKIPHKGGINESDFELLPHRPKMITKMPIRITTLSLMQLESKKIFWDIGACTGSISIDAKLNYPHLKIFAFEKRLESENIINCNFLKFQTPGIELIISNYLNISKQNFEYPDAVFLGGYGGEMEKVLNDVNKYILINGVLAFNSVSKKSYDCFIAWCVNNNYIIKNNMLLAVNQHNPINILVAVKK